GGADRHQVHGAGDGALRRLPGQRLGAVPDPDRQDAARHPGGLPHRDGRVLPLPAGPGDPVAPVGASGDAGTRASHRRHREAGRDRQHLLRSGQSRPHGPHPRREGAAGGAAELRDTVSRPARERWRGGAKEPPPLSINGPATGEVLVVGWGGTYGAITAAVEESQAEGKAVASVHLRYLNPLPPDLGHILRQYRRVLVPEINSGQLVRILRAE